MRHLGTSISNPRSTFYRTAGQTLWAGHDDDAGDLGLAWDWVQIAHGVVAMADPLAVVTNLRLVGEAGEVLDTMASALHINGIVHGLPWQDEVARALSRQALQ